MGLINKYYFNPKLRLVVFILFSLNCLSQTKQSKVFVFTRTCGYIHESIPRGLDLISELGKGNNFTVELLDGTIKQVSVQGKLCRGPKKQKILPKDYVLIEPIDNPLTGKWIIVHKYTKKNTTQLKKEGHIIQNNNKNEQNNFFENNTNNEEFIDDI